MNLTKENYKLIAAKLYRNPVMIDSEFAQDLMLTSRIIGRLKRFSQSGEIKVKLLYNHYIVACNCFGSDYVHRVLFLLSDKTTDSLILTMLRAFGLFDDDILIINEKTIIDIKGIDIIQVVLDKFKKELRT